MRERLRAGSLSGGATLVVTLSQIARAKLFAVALGVEGTGLIAQMSAVQSILLTPTPLFSGTPLLATLAVARAEGGMLARDRILAAARGLAVAATGGPGIAVAALAVLVGGELGALVALGAVAASFGILLGVEQVALQDEQRFGRLAASNALGASMALAIIAVLTFSRGLLGAAVGVAAGGAAAWLFTNALRSRGLPALRWDPASWARISRLGLPAVAGGTISTVGQAALRPLALATVGAAGAGIVHALAGLSLQLTLLAATGLVTYAAPRVAAAVARSQTVLIRDEIATIQLLGLTAMACGGLALSLVAAPVVTLILSDEFALVAALLPLQLAAELFLLTSWVTGTYLVPRGHRRVFVTVEALNAGTQLATAAALVPALGIVAFPIAHLAGSAIAAAAVIAHARRRIGLGSRPALAVLATGSVALVLVPTTPIAAVVGIPLVIVVALASSRSARSYLSRRALDR